MKKFSSICVALLPVTYGAMMLLCFKINMSDEVFFAILGVYSLLGFLFPLLYTIVSAKAEGRFLAVSNVWFYALNLMLYIAEIIFWFVRLEENRIAEQNGAMEGGLGLVLLVIFIYLPHWLSYLFTRIAGAISCSRALKGVCSHGVKGFHVFLHLFPVVGLFSTLWVRYRLMRL